MHAHWSAAAIAVQTWRVDPTSFPDIYVDGVSLHEGNRRHQLEMLEGYLRWIAADPAVAIAAAVAELQARGLEPDDGNLPFEIVMGYDYVEESLIEGHIPDGVLDLHRQLSEDLERMFWDAEGLAGHGLLSPSAFLDEPEWALQRDRARRTLSLWGLERDDQLLFDDPSE
jgi:hypothetical protein